MNWKNKRVLVTGAGGFIGSHLAERLVAAGAQTRSLVRYTSSGTWGWLEESTYKDGMEVVQGDVRDRDSVRAAMDGVDVVFNLAALIAIPYSYQAPLSYVRTNIEGALNVLQVARELETERVVQVSTSETYGSARYVPIDEKHPLQGQSPYSASKIAADMMAESFFRSFGLSVATARPFNTYGPRQSARAVIPTIITQALAGDEIRLGSLTPTRDLNFVDDTVDGFLAVAACPDAVGTVTNLGTGREIAIGDLAHTILEIMGKKLPIVTEAARFRPDNSEVDRLCADNTRAREVIGWQPRQSLEEGLRRTIVWLESHLHRYRPGVYAL